MDRTIAVRPVPSLLDTEWERLPTTRKVVALTLDGGANDAGAGGRVAADAVRIVAAP